MIQFKKTIAVVAVAAAVSLCGSAVVRASSDADVAAIHAADEAWAKAYNAGQLDNVVALYDENAVVYPPGAAPVMGRAAIRDYFAKDVPDFPKSGMAMILGPDPSGGVSGDTGWASGTWTLKDRDGNVLDSGWYFSVSKKVGGKWLYVRDAWNSAKVATPSTPAAK